jgi:hypothetical protein
MFNCEKKYIISIHVLERRMGARIILKCHISEMQNGKHVIGKERAKRLGMP